MATAALIFAAKVEPPLKPSQLCDSCPFDDQPQSEEGFESEEKAGRTRPKARSFPESQN